MNFLSVYGRVIGLLKPDRGIAIGLVIANLLVMGFQFAEPVLFGRVINLLTQSDTMTNKSVMGGAEILLAIWASIGLLGIVLRACGPNAVASVEFYAQ